MRFSRKEIGARGESAAIPYLESLGYQIIDSNIRPLPGMRRGEIDFVAWNEEALVFVEVKTRIKKADAAPAEAVDRRKRAQLVTLAYAYLEKHQMQDIPCRFDVVEVLFERGRAPIISLLKAAFDATDIEN